MIHWELQSLIMLEFSRESDKETRDCHRRLLSTYSSTYLATANINLQIWIWSGLHVSTLSSNEEFEDMLMSRSRKLSRQS